MDKDVRIIKGYFPKEFFILRNFGKETREIVYLANLAKKSRDHLDKQEYMIAIHNATVARYINITKIDMDGLSFLGILHYKSIMKDFESALKKTTIDVDDKINEMKQLFKLNSKESNDENSKDK